MSSPIHKEIARLLQAAQIERVIHVDDDFGFTQARCMALVGEAEPTTLVQLGLASEETLEAGEDAARRAAEANVGSAEVDTLQEWITGLIGHGGRELSDPALEALRRAWREVDAQEVSYAEWLEGSRDLIAGTAALLVVDDDLSKEGGGQTGGRELLSRESARLRQYDHCCILLTRKARDAESERELERELVDKYEALRHRIVVISKNSVNADTRRLLPRIKLALVNRDFEELQGAIRSAVDDSVKSAHERISQLNPNEIERVFARSSRLEGVWPVETLIRVLSRLSSTELVRSIRMNERAGELANRLEEVCHTVKDAEQLDAAAAEAESFMALEVYEEPSHINTLRLAPQLGDIYRHLQTDAHYILLAQPCDLAIRKTGRRRGNDLADSELLVPLVRIDRKTDDERLARDLQAGRIYQLPYYQTGPDYADWYVYFNQAHYVALDVLDLGALDLDGQCRLRVSKTEQPPSLRPLGWQRRASLLKDRFKKRINEANALLGYPQICTPIEVDEAHVVFPLNRHRRLREPYASAALSQFGAYLARVAYPHDLSRIR